MLRAPSLVLVALVAAACPAPEKTPAPARDLFDDVDPAIGTGGFGFAYGAAFFGAAAPHGLVKVGPDTTGDFGESRIVHNSGNWFEDPTILCFSHTHLHGTGVPEGGVVALMPTTSYSPESPRAVDYRATRVDEEAHPGSYRVRLQEPDIEVEFAATTHAAHHRITFPDGTEDAVVVIDLARTITEGEVTHATLARVNATTLRGSLHTIGSLSPPGGYDVFFVIAADSEFDVDAVADDVDVDLGAGAADGVTVRAALHLGARDAAHPLQLRVGLSYVDEDGAAQNLETELPGFDHDAATTTAEDAWRALLGHVRVDGGSDDDRTIFASALYRSFLMPTVMSDVDQRWRGPDGVIRTADGFRMMTDLSLWDTYRSVQPLYALVAKESARDVALSLVAFTEVLDFAPLWPMATGDAAVMIGSPGEVTLADALARGAVDADVLASVWPILRRNALDFDVEPEHGRQGRNDAGIYDALGYVPTTRRASVSSTLEYNIDDQALAVIADAMGAGDDAARLRERAAGWRLLYDDEAGFLRGRDESGAFSVFDGADFDPENFGEDYVEADAWQSLFPMNDVEGMKAVYGDADGVRAKLRLLLDNTIADWATRDPAGDLFGVSPLPFHWQGNEPSVHVSALPYDVDDRDLGFEFVTFVMETQYGPTPEGVPGNDDGGATSAWWVEAALGLHPIAGTDQWVLGTPRFQRVEIDVDNDEVLAIVGSADGSVARSVAKDGDVVGARIGHAELAAGGELVFKP